MLTEQKVYLYIANPKETGGVNAISGSFPAAAKNKKG